MSRKTNFGRHDYDHVKGQEHQFNTESASERKKRQQTNVVQFKRRQPESSSKIVLALNL